MDKNKAIIVTGAAGFIGSCLVGLLNQRGYENLILVDQFDDETKRSNFIDKKYAEKVERKVFFEWFSQKNISVHGFFHLGACTDTTEFDYAVHRELNLDFSKQVWQLCSNNDIPLVYASSAATYGDGSLGYSDDHTLIDSLQPLNPYGVSKNEFDKWALAQDEHPPFWAGLKFFNVYGPNEYHKARMASMVFHSFHQIKKNGKVKLFRSHKEGFADGEQLRDFIYVKDIVEVCYWLMETQPASAIYNLGTGTARSFNALVNATFAAQGLQPIIEYIDMPEDIRDKYQNFTEADMHKLRDAGYDKAFYTLEEGVSDYVKNFLEKGAYY